MKIDVKWLQSSAFSYLATLVEFGAKFRGGTE